jgi:hypothetical protein
MVPDLGYYFSPNEYFSVSAHSIERSLTFCVPMGFCIVVFILATRAGWEPFIGKLPREGVEPNRFTWFLITISAIWLGSVTHIFWDAWTHCDGFFVKLLPWLPYKELQHGSSLFGGIILAFALRQLPRKDAHRKAPFLIFLGVTVGVSAATTCAGFHPGSSYPLSDRRWVFLLLTGFLGNWLLLVAGIVLVTTIAKEAVTRVRKSSHPSKKS